MINLGLVGGSGLVGGQILAQLERRNLAIKNLFVLGKESVGKKISFHNKSFTIENLDEFDPKKIEYIIFSAGSEVAKKYVKKFLDANVSVIDMSSQFRYQPDVPLIIPEINIDELAKYQRPVLIANPNCSSAQLLLILKNIHTEFNISLLNIATYQAVSGTGQAAKDELNFQLTGTNNTPKIFPKPIANNVIPQCDVFLDNGFTKEEMKLDWETKKILDEDIDVIATCARVPVENGHSEAVFMQVKKKPNLERVISLLEEQEGVKVIDDTQNEAYPTPLEHAQFSDEVCVGRIRTSNSNQNFWISCWIVADNVFGKGAALNAIQILEEMIKRKL